MPTRSVLPPASTCRSLDTVEWHSAQVTPKRFKASRPSGPWLTSPLAPSTASSFSSASVVCGSSRGMAPLWMPSTTSAGRASASIFKPTDAAVNGSTADSITLFIISTSVQKRSSPKLSWRKVCWPAATSVGSSGRDGTWLTSSPPPPPPQAVNASVAAANTLRTPREWRQWTSPNRDLSVSYVCMDRYPHGRMKTDEFLRTRPGSGMHGREHPAGRPCIGCSGACWRYRKKIPGRSGRRHGESGWVPRKRAGARPQPIKRCKASRYFAAVCSITSAGNSGAGAVLGQGLPSTCAVSSQSRRYCLSKLGGLAPSCQASSGQ